MGTKGKPSSKKRKSRARNVPPFPFEFRLKVARLREEEGYPALMIAEQFGISEYSVYRWAKRYRQYGQRGLMNQPRKPSSSKLPEAVNQSIINLKKENPARGARGISDILKRFFMVGASPSTVQRTLREQGLTRPVKQKRKKNPSKPRFFERARPNQMWQSDIMTFRLAGKNAYLIGYIDDYSRYITGLGFYRSQTAEHVIETYRKAVGEYGVPDGTTIDLTGGQFSIGANGKITGAFSFEGGLSSQVMDGMVDYLKTFAVFVDLDNTGRMGFDIALKKGGSYLSTDLAGNWIFYNFTIDTVQDIAYWVYGNGTIDESGNLTGSYTAPDTSQFTISSGQAAIDSSGEITGSFTVDGVATETIQSGFMDQNKTIMVFVGTSDNWQMDLGIGMRTSDVPSSVGPAGDSGGSDGDGGGGSCFIDLSIK